MTDKFHFSQSSQNTIDYSTLILGLSSAALSYLGVNVSGVPAANTNLELAKQNIDIIELLKNKTKGNLTDDEERLTDQVLSDLQTRYVQVLKARS